MKIIIAKSEKEFDKIAADIVANQILRNPTSTIGFATGNTTIGFHKQLSELTKTMALDWSQIKSVNLDEFLGAQKSNPLSVYYRMFEQLLDNTNIKKENVLIPDSDINKAEKTCEQYADAVKAFGGVDLQVLGIGSNGHIAMNEPNIPWEHDMLITDIAKTTINDKAHLWGGIDKMPKKGVTMGMRLVMQAKTQLLMAKGASKAQAIFDTLKGEINPKVPSSALQMHPDLIVLVDEAAASML